MFLLQLLFLLLLLLCLLVCGTQPIRQVSRKCDHVMMYCCWKKFCRVNPILRVQLIDTFWIYPAVLIFTFVIGGRGDSQKCSSRPMSLHEGIDDQKRKVTRCKWVSVHSSCYHCVPLENYVQLFLVWSSRDSAASASSAPASMYLKLALGFASRFGLGRAIHHDGLVCQRLFVFVPFRILYAEQ